MRSRDPHRPLSLGALRRRLAAHRRAGERIVFTNGVFDLLHPGHVRYLRAAKQLGDVLVVGVNSDRSARALAKGPGRPLVPARDRAEVLAARAAVDYVTVFDQDTPQVLIRQLQPDVLVKGGDWRLDHIVGADLVRARGGRVRAIPFAPGYSTTALVERIRDRRRVTARRRVARAMGPC
ncbi:MAG: D-glycero-beta-D-manno-heptose 1-phosphate adenylyltransferase [Candidatus Binatia bacterium]